MTATDRALAAAVFVALAFAPRAARAEGDPLAANTLFEHGKQLMDEGKVEEACRAFAESQRLDPAGGTLLRLALCHEKLGKLATAAFEFHEVVRVSKEATADPDKMAERIRISEQELASIEPRVPKLAVNVPQASRIPALAVTANDLPRNQETWGIAIPIDPGDVIVGAKAPGHVDFKTVVHMGEGDVKAVDVPRLETIVYDTHSPLPQVDARPTQQTGGAQRPIAVVVGAVGLAAIGFGSYFGVRAISKWNDANDACPGTSCPQSAVSAADDARSAAHVADVAIPVGILAVAAGVVLWITGAPKDVKVGARSVTISF